ncbi:hypothetical protein QQX98_008299 [Neonectria punicea]|uniref:Extracellular membrane protein CFEM domain-containing protein n=1 Tax=Neonectria punicea TaxID=979145 RepID=A0ABR1GVF6_9HYPO
MKGSTLATILAVNVLGVSAALDTLAGYTADIPECAYSEFKKAMESENCEVSDVDSSSFECLCKHSSAIAVAVAKGVNDAQCSADFAQAVGSACGVWLVYGSTASELAKATSLLAEELSGNSPSTASDSSATATDSSSDAATAAASSSTNLAAVPTAGSGVAGLLGGAAALAAWFL